MDVREDAFAGGLDIREGDGESAREHRAGTVADRKAGDKTQRARTGLKRPGEAPGLNQQRVRRRLKSVQPYPRRRLVVEPAQNAAGEAEDLQDGLLALQGVLQHVESR